MPPKPNLRSSGAAKNADDSSGVDSQPSAASVHHTSSSNTEDESIPPDIDPNLYATIRLAVKHEFQSLRNEIDSIHSKLDDIINKEITPLKSRLSDVEDGLTHASDTATHIEKTCLPAIAQHVASLSQANHHEVLKIDAHRRKWNVIFHGIDGPADQDEAATRNAVKNFAKSVLKLSQEEINDTRFQACHRLSKKAGAGVIVRFSDLSVRDKWLAGARNIQSHLASLPPTQQSKRISMSIDLPPQIRPLKNELMQKRSGFPLEKKKKSKLRYLTAFPFVELRIEGESPLRPTTSLTEITKSTLGLALCMKMPKLDSG